MYWYSLSHIGNFKKEKREVFETSTEKMFDEIHHSVLALKNQYIKNLLVN